MPPVVDDRPKNIVLFSDGTGNSAAKPFKTNVWRAYQALDLETRQDDGRYQIAHYRNGVGTESFKPLALLGGAFGFGVMRDVIDLYAYLCRNYRHGDRIYAFGFSRGAFTIRLLVGLVARCGLVQATDENQLFHGTRAAHEAFRRDFLLRSSRSRGMIYHHLLAPPCYGDDGVRIELHLPREQVWPRIAFLGLWDTVDAYGMPIEELKQGIDRWIWPLSLADRKLSPIVEQACHALSLDDERPTFRPLLWDERDPADKARLEQRWFAGVHANVGGGYPIDDLAFVPLLWMIEKATLAGLWFCADQVRVFHEMKNVHGTSYDSRAGLAGYYRYGPRSLEKLCHDDWNDVHVETPLVHDSVAERIAARQVAYAPISLPRDLELSFPGSGETVKQDRVYVDAAWDAVFWRRITYFATLALTLFLLVAPFIHFDASALLDRTSDAAGETPNLFGFLPGGVSRLLAWVLGFLPSWAAPWTDAFEHHPFIAMPLVLLLAFLFFSCSATLQRSIEERSEWAWAAMKREPAAPVLMPSWPDTKVHELRTSRNANALAELYDHHIVPVVVGAGLLVLLIWFGIWLVWHLFTLDPFRLGVATAIAFVATCCCFLYNAGFRNFIDAHLGEDARVPERRWTYTVDDLYAFRTRAADIVLPDKRTLLQIYHGPVILPNDLVCAVAMGFFVALLGHRLALAAPDRAIWFHASAVFGALYAAADIAEDMLLALVFGSRGHRPKPAGMAPTATRAKMAFLTVSVTGGLLFLALDAIGRLMPARMPARS